MSNEQHKENFVIKPDQIGTLIKVARKQKGLTQTQLGKTLGVNQRTVSALERNPGSVSTARILHVLCLLGLTLSIQLETQKP